MRTVVRYLKSSYRHVNGGRSGGPGRVRTDDLFHAMEARSQLRHRPTTRKNSSRREGTERFHSPAADADSQTLAMPLRNNGKVGILTETRPVQK